ncbi:hypothetical protein TVAG_159770 [Trichomonas vaginalis G3]|uniref:Right handed beta helix domain-containing protein n=1 Tax=Trichomonas vaginalis (strain ATCC PRA-98 / G3) TaxID=412133 RepID=A2DUR9_TRIV3|nr:hypothetical protein TVAGG3_0259660 [Trichomonas vaginalis G3]EAY15804.1 hypothetical protein TVAG_159770 [Trichomonas vaginalis G3]KAI5525025.1 hypothetical protein TVAGG3_0259660 [Trichomonas vaginalis G3]|eukprot:XP_001328027.1 hypothetical protein [Trichomonas vaginalis G3]
MQMIYGKQIFNLCNITSNRVAEDIAGYGMEWVTSDSFIQFTTIRSNNQSESNGFALNYHFSLSNEQISVLSCNYIENGDSSGEGNLICAWPKLYMFGCCIVRNEVKYVIYNGGGSVVVNNSYTDNNQTLGQSVEFTNTISNSECKYYTVNIINNANKEDNDDDDSFFIKKVKQNVRYLDNRPKIIYFVLK